MCKDNYLPPNINDGRFFVSPILGCTGACRYCYLKINKYNLPRKNELKNENILTIARQAPDFSFGTHGTIISIGAWGDIFPLNDNNLTCHSINIIKYLLSWENPVQIMSKNALDPILMREISQEVRYPGQLLYSTTITTIDHWKIIEPGTASPTSRLKTALAFHNAGIPTNVLLKPFIPKLTGQEIISIANMLLDYKIDYCTLGVMYLSPEILERIKSCPFLHDMLYDFPHLVPNHLDCNGESKVLSTSASQFLPYVNYLRERGVPAFLKSSCVNSNILRVPNTSKYYVERNTYCINCGNCKLANQ